MEIDVLGKEDEWTFCVHILYQLRYLIIALFLRFVGLIYVNRYWWSVCPIYPKIEVYHLTITGYNVFEVFFEVVFDISFKADLFIIWKFCFEMFWKLFQSTP